MKIFGTLLHLPTLILVLACSVFICCSKPSVKNEDIERLKRLSVSELAARVKAGDPVAQFVLGAMYESGDGVPKDLTMALELWQESARQGNSYAQNNLGVMYYDGEGVPRDLSKAIEWWQKAADQGNPDSQVSIGTMYAFGEGVQKDSVKAFEWYQRAAFQGNPDAQYNLGVVYYEGEGVIKDSEKAMEWWQKAAERGQFEAKSSLASAYLHGDGVPKDYVKGLIWWAKADWQTSNTITKIIQLGLIIYVILVVVWRIYSVVGVFVVFKSEASTAKSISLTLVFFAWDIIKFVVPIIIVVFLVWYFLIR